MKNILVELDDETKYLESIEDDRINWEIKLDNLKKNNWHNLKISQTESNLNNKLGLVYLNFECSVHDVYDPLFSESYDSKENYNTDFDDIFIKNEAGNFKMNKRRTSLPCRKVYNDNLNFIKYFELGDLEYIKMYNEKSIDSKNLSQMFLINLIKKTNSTFSDYYDIEYIKQLWETSRLEVNKNANKKKPEFKRQKITKKDSLDCEMSLIEKNSQLSSIAQDSLLGIMDKINNKPKEIIETKFRKRKNISISSSLGGNQNPILNINLQTQEQKSEKCEIEDLENNLKKKSVFEKKNVNYENASTKFIKKKENVKVDEIKNDEIIETKIFKLSEEIRTPININSNKKFLDKDCFYKNPPNTLDDRSTKKIESVKKIDLVKVLDSNKQIEVERQIKNITSIIKKTDKSVEQKSKKKLKKNSDLKKNPIKIKSKNFKKIIEASKQKLTNYNKKLILEIPNIKCINDNKICKTERAYSSHKGKKLIYKRSSF